MQTKYFRQRTHHVNQLRQLEFELDGDCVRDVHDGSDQLVVGGQQVVKQPLGVGVAAAGALKRVDNDDKCALLRISVGK